MGKILDRRLTDKQASFVSNYLIDKNATQAAIRAGYSKRSAEAIGDQLLGKTIVVEAINKALQKQQERVLITADEVILELKRVAMLDIKEAFDENGNLKNLEDMPEDTRRAISGIETEIEYSGKGADREEVGFVKKIKLSDKVRALELLAKHLKLLTEKVEGEIILKGNIGLSIKDLQESLEKCKQQPKDSKK
jgi:phage terminase small subunit